MENATLLMDLTPSLAADPVAREGLKGNLRERFERELDRVVERNAKLPDLMIQWKNEATDTVFLLLSEARQLYCLGAFYGCVAMCGIVAERLIKDMIRGTVLVLDGSGSSIVPSAKAFNQLERIDAKSVMLFAAECGLVSDATRKAADNLIEIRNKYAHARAQTHEAEADALKAVGLLHQVVDGTISILKDFEIHDGIFVKRLLTSKGHPVFHGARPAPTKDPQPTVPTSVDNPGPAASAK